MKNKIREFLVCILNVWKTNRVKKQIRKMTADEKASLRQHIKEALQ